MKLEVRTFPVLGVELGTDATVKLNEAIVCDPFDGIGKQGAHDRDPGDTEPLEHADGGAHTDPRRPQLRRAPGGSPVGTPRYHILEEQVRAAIPADVYAREIGPMEFVLDKDSITAALERLRQG